MTQVSIIVPCFNEEQTITILLVALYAQSYPRKKLEVIIADGFSEDQTRARIAAFQDEYPDLTLMIIDNPSRSIPAGLNLALAAAKGEIVVRLDAHSVPDRDYVARSAANLEAGRGANVGGVWEIQPGADTWMARSIALAAAHPLGVGDANYRLATSARAQAVDTVPFGAFKRSLVGEIGPFDESLQTNEDYEFNHRIRQRGLRVWLDPAIRSIYFARPTLGALARQYWRYGYWKWRMLKRFPRSLRWRQFAAPAFVAGLVGMPLLSIWWPGLLRLWGSVMVLYGLLLGGAGALKGIQMKDIRVVIGLSLAMATMHLAWGSAFLYSIFSSGSREA
ncbi:MAG: glycosyltransferase family 2 protein [Chloroflexi bacterium]|nr:glycosyltransferase family 2 protein [Chloroflexota bacterium]